MNYIWTIYDPKLNMDVLNMDVEDEDLIFDEEGNAQETEDIIETLYENLLAQTHKVKPFLDKYGLVLSLQERLITSFEPVPFHGFHLIEDGDYSEYQMEALPEIDGLEFDDVIANNPWLTINKSETTYPLYWEYNRELRASVG